MSSRNACAGQSRQQPEPDLTQQVKHFASKFDQNAESIFAVRRSLDAKFTESEALDLFQTFQNTFLGKQLNSFRFLKQSKPLTVGLRVRWLVLPRRPRELISRD